jgi:hypothetical protein
MDRKKAIFAAISIALVLLMTSAVLSTAVHHSGLPKVDDIYYKAYPGALPETIVNEFVGGTTDWIGGPSKSALHQQVLDAGHIVSEMDPMAEFTFFPINCRDYKETSGDPNAPLNDSDFRVALTNVYGVNDKQNDIFGYYGVGWQYAIWNPVPDAQLPWYNSTIRMPNTDFEEAYNILYAAGYRNDTDWLTLNGQDVRPGGTIDCLYSTGATFYPDGPMGGMVDAWNAFLVYLGVDGPQMTITATDFMTLVYELMIYHDYDIIGIGLTNMGRYVDWIFDLTHSSNDVTFGWNFAGIHDSEFDTWGEIILTSLDVDEIIEAASDWQEKFVYDLMPWVPVRAGLEFCTTANDTRGRLRNVISMDNYGPSNDYSWMCLHWEDGVGGKTWPGGSYIRALGDEPSTMNPYNEDTLYGWQLLDRAIVGLLGVNPVTLKDMPWIATNWTVDHWTSIPELGIVDGSTATFFVRQDVKWQDWRPGDDGVDAYDCVANMRAMRVYEPGRYSGTWEHLVYEEADGPYKFNVYFDSTSLYHAGNVAGTALLVPEHVIEKIEEAVDDGDLDTFFDWNPSYNNYADLMDRPPPTAYPSMKQIVGCGPFVFDYYDPPNADGHVTKYGDHFITAPIIGSVQGEWRVEPGENYTYKPLLQNLGAKTDTAEGECTNMTVNVEIYEGVVLKDTVNGVNLGPWEWTYLGQYETGAATIGYHTITVMVYDAEDDSLIHTYIHAYVGTIREDVNTYTGELLDFTVDMRDVGRAARSFGSYPAHLRWDPPCDVDENFEVDMRDIGRIARKFGWPVA